MNATINISGKIMSVLNKTFEDKTTVNVQFLKESEKKGIEVIKVKLTEQEDILKVEQGQLISIPVNIACVNNNLYYSQSGTIKYPREAK